MFNHYIAPLSIHFVWSPSDQELAEPIIDIVKNNFSRDKNKPFSRAINLPLFFYSSSNGNKVPNNIPSTNAQRNVIFVFTSLNTLGNEAWKEYIQSFHVDESIRIVPVALDTYGLNHQGPLNGLNCIRAYDWQLDNKYLIALVSLSHEIYRHGLCDGKSEKTGNSDSIKIFLSHSKSEQEGRAYVKKVKDFIDQTNIGRFFDVTEIAAGFSFSDEIEKHISDATLIAFETDSYFSRYWCQREILSAKQKDRPILVVNCLNEYEDRIFPASSNVPCISVPTVSNLSELEVLRVLSSALTETIRFQYSKKILEEYQKKNWFSDETKLIFRPPEVRKMFELKKKGVKKVCYPDPPVFMEEADWHAMIEIEAITPLWNPSDINSLSHLKVGLSISDCYEDSFESSHLNPDQLLQLAQDLARHLLARSASLVYGGDLRPNGLTEFILDEALVLTERLTVLEAKVENHLAWPLSIETNEVRAWRAKYSRLMRTVEHDIPADVAHGIDSQLFLKPITPNNSFIWSRSLTEMRKIIVENSSVRICVGGKLAGYKGKMPGVLEEIILSINCGKPIFLLGGFNGVVGDVCKVILDKDVPKTLTEEWQIQNTPGYSELQEIAKDKNCNCDYDEIINILKNVDINLLAKNVGLSVGSYKQLMKTPFIDECTYLILSGLKKIS